MQVFTVTLSVTVNTVEDVTCGDVHDEIQDHVSDWDGGVIRVDNVVQAA